LKPLASRCYKSGVLAMKTLLLMSLLAACLVTTGCAGKTWQETLMDAGTQPGCIPPSIQIRLAQEGKPVPPCNRPAQAHAADDWYRDYQQGQHQQQQQMQQQFFQRGMPSAPQLPQQPVCRQVWVSGPNGQGQYLTICR